MRSRTATSLLYVIVHCRYCTNLAGLSKSKLSFICCMKCDQEENKDKWRSFAFLSAFLATAILFGPFSHGSKIHISSRPRTSHSCRVDSAFITVYLGIWWGPGGEGGGQKNCLILPPTFALLISDRTSVVKIWCTSQIEASTSPRATPRAFELLKIGLFKFPPLGAKKPFKCPTHCY